MRTNGVANAATVQAGSNTGAWFGDMAGRDQASICAHNQFGSGEVDHGEHDIGEILIYDTKLGAGDLADVETYLADRWGVTLP